MAKNELVEEMERDLLDAYDDEEEQNEVLEGIEKIKSMSQEDISRIASEWNERYDELQYDLGIEDEGCVTYARDKLLPEYKEKHPDAFDEDGDFLDADAFYAFVENHDDYEHHIISAIGDNEGDECARQATDEISEEYGLHRDIIKKIDPRAL
jgi:hypothetical protein